MRVTASIFALLLQCASSASYAAKGHTTNNGGNLAEIRFTEIWKNFDRLTSACLTPLNLCRLTPEQLIMLTAAIQNKPKHIAKMPDQSLLYLQNGSAKSEAEMYEITLSILQECGPSLSTASLKEIADQALRFSYFSAVNLSSGHTWYVFERDGLQIENHSGIHDFTPGFRKLLRLSHMAPLDLKQIVVRKKGVMIEISGRIQYTRGSERQNGFTLLIHPPANGEMPAPTELVIFK